MRELRTGISASGAVSHAVCIGGTRTACGKTAGWARLTSAPVRTLDNILLAYGALERDRPLTFHLTDDRDDLLLGGFDFFDPDRTERFDIVFHHFRAARGHSGEEVLFELITGAFE